MNCKVFSVDLAKDVFEIAIASCRYRVLERKRLDRKQFHKFLMVEECGLVIMEACGSSHYWAREAERAGHQVELIPAQYVKPYRRRGKSDRIDTDAIIEAHRFEGITSVPVSSVEQQQIQQLHRIPPTNPRIACFRMAPMTCSTEGAHPTLRPCPQRQ